MKIAWGPTAALLAFTWIGAAQAQEMDDEGLMPVMLMVGDLVIENPWTRATPAGAPAAGGYLKIVNHGNTAEVLTGGIADIADHVEIHEMSMADGVMTMQALAEGIEIGPDETVVLEPGGYHVMLIGLSGAIAEGDVVAVTLNFANAGPIAVEFHASAIGGASPYSDGMGGTHQSDMDDMDGMEHMDEMDR